MHLMSFTANPEIIIIALIFLATWLILLTLLFYRSEQRFHHLVKGAATRDLRSILEHIQSENRLTLKQVEQVRQALEAHRQEALGYLQKVGFLRYNPFGDTGGDQSFCLSLLDGHDNGIVISSLHSRDQTRIYAKKIDSGQSKDYTLSKEERAVIKKAQIV